MTMKTIDTSSADHNYPTKTQAYTTVAVLTIANVVAFVDRYRQPGAPTNSDKALGWFV